MTAAVVGAAGAGALAGRASAASTPTWAPHKVVPFRGERQAGIVTPQQDRMHFCAFDVTTDKRDEVVALLKQWTAMAERMTLGEEAVANGAVGENPYAPPSDTGEALGLPASQLTLTIGFGPSFFEKDGKDRFGIADQRPAALADLPKFTNETLDPAKCGGDICVQACANDPQVAVHAVRNLARVGFGTVAVRYSQLGFGRTSSTTREQVDAAKPDGLQGRNQQPQGRGHRRPGPERLGGQGRRSGLADRRHLPGDATHPDAHRELGPHHAARAGAGDRSAEGQRRTQRLRRRVRADGLQHQGRRGHTARRRRRPRPTGRRPTTSAGSRCCAAATTSPTAQTDSGTWTPGLFFIAFVRSPATNFVPVLAQMSTDALNEYITHTGTAVFACPPGLREGDSSAYWGSTLFG